MDNVIKVKSLIDDFDSCILKRTSINMYKVDIIVPTVKLFFEKQSNFMNLGCTRTLKNIFSVIGFKCCKTQINTKTSYTFENNIILTKILVFRRQGRKIVYTDKSYVLTSHVVNRSWSSVI